MRTGFYLPFIIYLVPGFGHAFFFQRINPTEIWFRRIPPNILSKDDDLVSNSKLYEELLSKTKARNGIPYENSVRNNQINENEKNQFILMQEALKDRNREVTSKHEAFPLKEKQFSPSNENKSYYIDPLSIYNTVPQTGIHLENMKNRLTPNSKADNEFNVFAVKTPYQDVKDEAFHKQLFDQINGMHKSFNEKDEEDSNRAVNKLRGTVSIKPKSETYRDTDNKKDYKFENEVYNTPEAQIDGHITINIMDGNKTPITTPRETYMVHNTKQSHSTKNVNPAMIDRVPFQQWLYDHIIGELHQGLKAMGYQLLLHSGLLGEESPSYYRSESNVYPSAQHLAGRNANDMIGIRRISHNQPKIRSLLSKYHKEQVLASPKTTSKADTVNTEKSLGKDSSGTVRNHNQATPSKTLNEENTSSNLTVIEQNEVSNEKAENLMRQELPSKELKLLDAKTITTVSPKQLNTMNANETNNMKSSGSFKDNVTKDMKNLDVVSNEPVDNSSVIKENLSTTTENPGQNKNMPINDNETAKETSNILMKDKLSTVPPKQVVKTTNSTTASELNSDTKALESVDAMETVHNSPTNGTDVVVLSKTIEDANARVSCKQSIKDYLAEKKNARGSAWITSWMSIFAFLNHNGDNAIRDKDAEATVKVLANAFGYSNALDSTILQISNTCYIDEESKRTVLMELVYRGYYRTLSNPSTWIFFLPQNYLSLPWFTDSKGNNLFHLAAMSKDIDVLRAVFFNLQRILTVDAIRLMFIHKNTDNHTPLTLAQSSGSIDVRNFLAALYRVLIGSLKSTELFA